MGFLTRLFTRPMPRMTPSQEMGVPGFSAVGGYLMTGEKHPTLQGTRKFVTFDEWTRNVDILGLSIFYYLDLIMSADWHWDPPADLVEDEEAKEKAEAVKDIFTHMRTPWKVVVGRLAMFKPVGFAIGEWTLKMREDDTIGFLDIAARPAWTVEKWQLDEHGTVVGFWQADPNTGEEKPIPRAKCVYIVENTVSDIPEGLGLMRLAARAVQRLQRYEQLEGYGFEADLRGTPIGYAPLDELWRAQNDKKISEGDRDKIEKPIRTFVEDHFVRPDRGLVLDSSVYRALDNAAMPTNVRKWSLELVKGGNTTQEAMHTAIERLNRQIARIFGTEHILLGSDKGAYNLSEDKTNMLMVRIDGVLGRIAEVVDAEDGPVDVIFESNGWDKKYKPKSRPEAVKFRDVEKITVALANMSKAGSPIVPGDPVVNRVRNMLDLPEVPEEMEQQIAMDAALRRGAEIGALEAKAMAPAGAVGADGKPRPGGDKAPAPRPKDNPKNPKKPAGKEE